MKRFIVLVLLLEVLITNTIHAQIFTQVIDEREFQYKVNLIDEFFSRFNYEIDYKGEPIATQGDSIASDSIYKRKNLMTILNLDTFANDENELDSVSSAFLDYVINEGKQIHYADTTWFAEAFTSLKIEGKSYPASIFLCTEHVKDVIYKWVIMDVESSLFASLTDTIQPRASIMPGAHGTSFITLPGTVNLNAASVQSLFPKSYKPNILSVFAYLISSGKMEMQMVSKVNYHFHLGDYDFTVERFEKENSYNKGWLISKITKAK